MVIRVATNLDREDIRNVHWLAFTEGDRELVSKLAVNLLLIETTPPTISLVAEVEGAVVGHAAFSPVTALNNQQLQGYILAPLGVRPHYQKRGVGSKLVKRGIQQLSKMGVDNLLVYGDPNYYSRFGFTTDFAERYLPPYKLQYPFGWQGMALNEGSTEQWPIEIACVPPLCDPALW